MHRLLRLAVLAAALVTVASVAAAAASAASTSFQATFVDVYSQCPTSPPTLVFCGDGTVAGFGAASSIASLTAPPAPILGSDCLQIKAVRTIALSDGPTTLRHAAAVTVAGVIAAAFIGTAAGAPTGFNGRSAACSQRRRSP